MRNILVPVDLSEISLPVIERASCFGQSLASRLWLLHVVPIPSQSHPFNLDRQLWRRETARGLRDRRRQLHDLAGQLRREHNHVHSRFLTGTVNTTILAESLRVHADLIIMGSHGHGNIYHVLFGGAGQKVMRKARCPVMLVAPDRHRSDWHIPGGDSTGSQERPPP